MAAAAAAAAALFLLCLSFKGKDHSKSRIMPPRIMVCWVCSAVLWKFVCNNCSGIMLRFREVFITMCVECVLECHSWYPGIHQAFSSAAAAAAASPPPVHHPAIAISDRFLYDQSHLKSQQNRFWLKPWALGHHSLISLSCLRLKTMFVWSHTAE